MIDATRQGLCGNCNAANSYANHFCARCRASLPWAGTSKVADGNDKPSVILNVFSLLFPIVGLVAWLILMRSQPRTAREAGICALVSVLLAPLIIFLIPVLFGT